MNKGQNKRVELQQNLYYYNIQSLAGILQAFKPKVQLGKEIPSEYSLQKVMPFMQSRRITYDDNDYDGELYKGDEEAAAVLAAV